MKKKIHGFYLCLLTLSISILSACVTDNIQSGNDPVLPSSGEVTNRCLSRIAANNAPPPLLSQLNDTQWPRYISCSLSSNMSVKKSAVPDNPEAIVSIRLQSDGTIESATLLHSSGNPAWDAAVQRAISAASPFPPAPVTRRFSRIDLHFRPVHQTAGIGGSTGLVDESHWTERRCTTVGGTTACN